MAALAMGKRCDFNTQPASEIEIKLRWEFGQTPPWDDEMTNRISEAELMLDGKHLAPDWQKQILRCVVPCKEAKGLHWRRVCRCITLGRLFAVLGRDYSADVLYHFYRTRRIVIAKMRRT